ncbi:MAG: hypothetical protein ACP5OK_09660, partial [Thermoprotei archaeon]
VKTLIDNYKLYDLHVWSKYDVKHIANPFYHLLNAILMYIIARLAKSDTLFEVSQRWLKYLKHGALIYYLLPQSFYVADSLLLIMNKLIGK